MKIDYKKETPEERKIRLENIGLEPSVSYSGLAHDFDFEYEPLGIRDFLKLFGIDIKKIKYKLQEKKYLNMMNEEENSGKSKPLSSKLFKV